VTFEILGEIEQIETIAVGAGVRARALLNKAYGKGRWRKRKGIGRVRLPGGVVRRVELHWYGSPRHRATRLQDQGVRRLAMKRSTRFAVCLDNAGNEASLNRGKIYVVLPDARAAKDDLIRIVDESSEDYLFSAKQFEVVDFPQAVRRKLLALQRAG
jgi:hypothetical protein